MIETAAVTGAASHSGLDFAVQSYLLHMPGTSKAGLHVCEFRIHACMNYTVACALSWLGLSWLGNGPFGAWLPYMPSMHYKSGCTQ